MVERIKKLEELIEYHREKYYNSEAEISDAEFDALWDELKRIDPNNALFAEVGKDESGHFPKRKHVLFMCSQDKVTTPEEFKKWFDKTPCPVKLCQWKLDGISLEVQYQRGKFVRAVTRGDGEVGDDITDNVKKMKGFVGDTLDDFTGAVRAEIVMLHDTFKSKYADKYANARNLSSGFSKRKSGDGCEDLFLVYYDAIAIDGSVIFTKESNKIAWLRRVFNVVESKEFLYAEEIVEYREDIMKRRDQLGVDIDGLVIKCDLIDEEDAKRATPKNQIAFKFPTQNAVSTVREVEWSVSGNTLTPVAIIDAVSLAGTTVRRASLANPDEIRRLGLKIGSSVLVSKRGDIIPKVEKVVNNPSTATNIVFPTTCDSCGSALMDSGAKLYCPNEQCDNRAFHRLSKWIAKLGVKNFGDVVLKKLFDAGKVKKVADLYDLKESDISSLERQGDRSAEIAVKNLLAVKEASLARFIGAFDIEGIGESIAQLVTDAGYDTLESIKNASVSDLTKVKGMGEINADALIKGVRSLYGDMTAVLAKGKLAIKTKKVGGGLNGKSFCFTGALKTIKRDGAQKLVEDHGGVFKKSVVKGLSFLVTNTPASGTEKNQKATELGVKIVTEAQFLEMIK